MNLQLKYARVERERRFLVDQFPRADVARIRHIDDLYIDATNLRLRELRESGRPAQQNLIAAGRERMQWCML